MFPAFCVNTIEIIKNVLFVAAGIISLGMDRLSELVADLMYLGVMVMAAGAF